MEWFSDPSGLQLDFANWIAGNLGKIGAEENFEENNNVLPYCQSDKKDNCIIPTPVNDNKVFGSSVTKVCV